MNHSKSTAECRDHIVEFLAAHGDWCPPSVLVPWLEGALGLTLGQAGHDLKTLVRGGRIETRKSSTERTLRGAVPATEYRVRHHPSQVGADLKHEERLRRAEAGTDPWPHLPGMDGTDCAYCGRPDWEAVGNCLARVRSARQPLVSAMLAVEDLEQRIDRIAPGRPPMVCEAQQAINTVRDALRRAGVSPDDVDVVAARARRVMPATPTKEPLPEGFRLGDPANVMCGGRGPAYCRKGNSCRRHNGCVYVGVPTPPKATPTEEKPG